jgi:hypothetical protein
MVIICKLLIIAVSNSGSSFPLGRDFFEAGGHGFGGGLQRVDSDA